MERLTYHQYLGEICANCGGTRGQHNNINKRCPKDINASADLIEYREYRKTVFNKYPTDLQLAQREIIQLKADLEIQQEAVNRASRIIDKLGAENLRLSNDLADAKEENKKSNKSK